MLHNMVLMSSQVLIREWGEKHCTKVKVDAQLFQRTPMVCLLAYLSETLEHV